MPYISNETLIGAALLIVLVFGYQYLPTSAGLGSDISSTHQASQSKSSKKRNKKKQNKPLNTGGPSKAHKESDSIVLGKSPEKPKGASVSSGHHNKGVQQKKGIKEGDKAALGQIGEKGPQATTSSGETKNVKEQQSQQQARKKLLAEKLLPKEPKTKVDDMLAPEDRPGQIARVMKLTSNPNKSSNGTSKSNSFAAFTQPTSAQDEEDDESEEEAITSSGAENGKIAKFEGDYVDLSDDDVEERNGSKSKKMENDGWDVVTSKKKKSSSLNISSDPFASQSTSLPLPAGSASRQQKKNAKKSEGKKLAREAEEAERQRRLALHKKDLERERINELYASKQSNPNRGKALGRSGSNTVGGGSKATLDVNGKLVWD